jgi:hypothetical protein
MKASRLLPLGLSIWLVARSSGATANFPAVVQRDLALSYQPPCAWCHSGGVTMRGTTNTPFGKALRARGLAAYDENSLRAALEALRTEHVDSDGDMTGDIDELKNGTDPNVSDVPGLGISGADAGVGPPVYGCGLGSVRSGPRGSLFLLFALLLRVHLRPARRRPNA